ncbi:MAG: class I SAM-dependent methyltransferase, partial [Bryobacteraceae bacterium]|nr:class I SAM-dependent methyltransferase [Bryobacteraceae bacterium]
MKRQRFEDSLRRLAPAGSLAPEQVEALWRHYELLERWNARINLTRVIELEEAARFHYGESLFVAAHLPEGIRTVADVGSGAGFPGFVIAVARPELEVTLIESDQRKAAFLREASDLAPNVRVVARRSREVTGR